MAIPVNNKLVTVESLKAGLDMKANAADVYTKSQADSAISSSKWTNNYNTHVTVVDTAHVNAGATNCYRSGNVVYLSFSFDINNTTGAMPQTSTLLILDDKLEPVGGYFMSPIFHTNASIPVNASCWLEHEKDSSGNPTGRTLCKYYCVDTTGIGTGRFYCSFTYVSYNV